MGIKVWGKRREVEVKDQGSMLQDLVKETELMVPHSRPAVLI
jgi:hypothetical protein